MGRFDLFNPLGDLGTPEETGILPCAKEFELATPSLARHELVSIVAANHSLGQSLLVQLEWVPLASGGGGPPEPAAVTLVTRLQFNSGQPGGHKLYEFTDTETYRQESPSSGGDPKSRWILRYGSQASKLKLSIACPYRRMRLCFMGQASESTAADAGGDAGEHPPGGQVFLKLSCVFNTAANLFDFTASDPLNDRHEQVVKLNGEFSVIRATGADGQPQPQQHSKHSFTMRGFHARQFLHPRRRQDGGDGDGGGGQPEAPRRLMAMATNGQLFHVTSAGAGYSSFGILSMTKPLDRPCSLDWASVGPNLGGPDGNLEFQVFSEGETVACSLRPASDRLHKGAQFYRISLGLNQGWAYVSLEDSLGSEQAVEESRRRFLSAYEAGRLAREYGQLEELRQSRPKLVRLDDDRCTSSQLVGSKGSSLALLNKVGPQLNFRTPFAVMLTRYAYDEITSPGAAAGKYRPAIDRLAQLVASNELDKLREECRQLEETFKAGELPHELAEALVGALREHYGDSLGGSQDGSPKFAVRSSSWGEDEADMSAAGQLTTVLNVRGELEALSKASMECFGSKFSRENIDYKRQHGLPLDLTMAVVVQEMVQCDKAGVMFTCDPTTGDDGQLLITANYGLGESVVNASADPDTIRVRILAAKGGDDQQPELKIDKIEVGKKLVIISEQQDLGQQVDRTRCCLSDDEILRLARCGLELKRYFHDEQRDIEWGFKGDQLYMFQARPVTGLEAYTEEELLHEYEKPSRAEKFFFTRANIGEVMPYAIKPFTQSYSLFSWGCIGMRMYIRLGKDIDFSPHCTNEVFYEQYHIYFNLAGGPLLSLGASPDEKPIIARSMEISMFGREMEPQPDIQETVRGLKPVGNLLEGFKFDLLTTPLRWMPRRACEWERKTMIKLRDNVQNLRLAVGYEENKLRGLFNQMKLILRGIYKCWENHIFVIGLNGKQNFILSLILSNYIKDPMQLSAAANRFLAITPDVVSAQIPELIRKMATTLRAPERAQLKEKFLAETDYDKILELIESDKELNEQYKYFIERYGHRGYAEFEMAEKPWRENPMAIVDMIKLNCKSPAELGTKKQETIDEIFKSLGLNLTFKDKLVLKYKIIPGCQELLAAREITKDILIMYGDIMRQGSRMLAEEMRRQMRLPDSELFYYLYYDEVESLIEDYQPGLVMQALRRRQLFKKYFKDLWVYDEIIRDWMPNNLKPSKELEEKISQAPRLLGTPASSGKARGKVCLVKSFRELDRVVPGSILLTHSTDIAFSPIFPMISGIITEVGGLISHGAVVAREYGLPSVIGIPDVTRILQDGEEILLDADNGAIVRLSKVEEGKEA